MSKLPGSSLTPAKSTTGQSFILQQYKDATEFFNKLVQCNDKFKTWTLAA